MPPTPKPRFFRTPADFRAWLDAHHDTATELWVGYYKKDSGRPSITWPESVDEALCVGWIDGIRKSLDAESYVIRFTPRRATSTWSAVNIQRMAVLEAEGRVRPAGREAFALRRPEASGTYAYENRDAASLTPAEERRFRRSRGAWAFFQRQPAGYRHTAVYWIASAKRAATRERRLSTLIDCSASGERLPQLARPAKRSS